MRAPRRSLIVAERPKWGSPRQVDGIDKLTASDERKLFAILTPQLLRSNGQTHGPDGAGRTPPTPAGVAG